MSSQPTHEIRKTRGEKYPLPVPNVQWQKNGRPDKVLPPVISEKSRQVARREAGKIKHRDTKTERRAKKVAVRNQRTRDAVLAGEPAVAAATATATATTEPEKEKKKKLNGRTRKAIGQREEKKKARGEVGAEEEMNVGMEEAGGENFVGWEDEVALRPKEN
ncbi:hypothetical protein HYFRA_00003891 [Hymenoscyphus fraxineus]|uniref:Uncharacterized protein n=1 Tax=Hymenoscyphus fraxineus TaxID=746836 RepID=A0A9N9KZ33_9HELO|nr:hypothetical protein HYFRA_00003891 [Hymenoscyphus fraxineus]